MNDAALLALRGSLQDGAAMLSRRGGGNVDLTKRGKGVLYSNFVPAGAWTEAGDADIDPAFKGKRQKFSAVEEEGEKVAGKEAPVVAAPAATAPAPPKGGKRARVTDDTVDTPPLLTTVTLPPGTDLLAGLTEWAKKRGFSGVVLGAAGELDTAVVFPPNDGDGQRIRGPLRVCSLSGGLGGEGDEPVLALVVAGGKLKAVGGAAGEGTTVGGTPLRVHVLGVSGKGK